MVEAPNKSAEVPSIPKVYAQNKTIAAKLRIRMLRCNFLFNAIELSGYMSRAGVRKTTG